MISSVIPVIRVLKVDLWWGYYNPRHWKKSPHHAFITRIILNSRNPVNQLQYTRNYYYYTIYIHIFILWEGIIMKNLFISNFHRKKEESKRMRTIKATCNNVILKKLSLFFKCTYTITTNNIPFLCRVYVCISFLCFVRLLLLLLLPPSAQSIVPELKWKCNKLFCF